MQGTQGNNKGEIGIQGAKSADMRILPMGSAGTDLTFVLVPQNSAIFCHDNPYHTEKFSWYTNNSSFL